MASLFSRLFAWFVEFGQVVQGYSLTAHAEVLGSSILPPPIVHALCYVEWSAFMSWSMEVEDWTGAWAGFLFQVGLQHQSNFVPAALNALCMQGSLPLI